LCFVELGSIAPTSKPRLDIATTTESIKTSEPQLSSKELKIKEKNDRKILLQQKKEARLEKKKTSIEINKYDENDDTIIA
jgi:hypothetical protein